MLECFPDVLTVEQCAAALQISKNNVYALIKTDALHCKKVGKLIRVPKVYLIAFLEEDVNVNAMVNGRAPP